MLPIVFKKIMVYIVVLILVAIDFWVCKNIIGRKLVKLRWWYTINDAVGGKETWVFEHRYGNYYYNIYILLGTKTPTSDYLIFWGILWGHYIAWGALCAMNAVTF
jgi:hypothetical protein